MLFMEIDRAVIPYKVHQIVSSFGVGQKFVPRDIARSMILPGQEPSDHEFELIVHQVKDCCTAMGCVEGRRGVGMRKISGPGECCRNCRFTETIRRDSSATRVPICMVGCDHLDSHNH
ncbi:MAG: hypothetical protein US39_C0008G0014 [Microgenomates group bacterium GW2011_GWC1_37_12b]|uniref:Uncharacterized protein n=1 Tax=Candidatus Woesebacteria bacterium GW2011_GWB1_38_8b TaxID=1618571 RepID=A0A0G0LGB2_9BACT|nr:MAG: hypothetical protein US39_C0008G0014 [Microgenomates group bacterium GW2011_GWC1_37_12b]KKQ86980.1 MAG: hypothetical protein UT10_C0013G0029 [Candidatus Woesebacteria bacterium GW2011_GWB1_38_8b]